MPRDDKKITLDDILAEYERCDGLSGGNRSDMEISEEISIDGDEDLDDVEIIEESFEEPASGRSWKDAGVEDIPVISGTYDGKDGDKSGGSGGTGEADTDGAGTDRDKTDASEQNKVDAGEEETSGQDSLIAAMESSDDVNDRWLAKIVKTLFPVKGDSVWEVIRKIIFLIAVIVFIGAGIMLISTLIQSKQTLDHEIEEKNIITTTVATSIDSDGNVVIIPPTPEEIAKHNFDVAAYYKEFNSDYVGYLDLYGCDIHKPVVKGDDNDYYLHTNIFGNYNKAGTIFMDYRCSITDDYTSPNLVIYGHNQEDGTMFGNLKLYKQDVPFYQKNPVVQFSTETETWEYLIYGFFVTHIYEKQDSNGEVFHYHDYIDQINDEETFEWYIGEIQKRNQIISPVDVQFGDQLLCLSTCSNEFTDSRFVVFARRLREGETAEDYDFSEARLNPYAQGVDWEAIISGMTSDTSESYYEEPTEVVTSEKSLNKRNVRTETTASEDEALTEETTESTVTTVPAETEETSETVVPSESSETESTTESSVSSAATTSAAATTPAPAVTSTDSGQSENTDSSEETSESGTDGSDNESVE